MVNVPVLTVLEKIKRLYFGRIRGIYNSFSIVMGIS